MTKRIYKCAYELLTEGDAARETGDLAHAYGCYQKALKTAPLMGEAPYGLGRVEFSRTNYREALRYFRELIHRDQTDHEAYYYLGLTCRNLSLTEEGDEFLKEAHRLQPKNPHYALALAVPYFVMGAYDRCLEVLRYGESMNNPEVLNLMGKCHYSINEIEKARKFWKKSLSLEPDQKDIIDQLNSLKKEASRFQQNRKEIKLAVFSQLNSFLGDVLQHFRQEYTAQVYSGKSLTEMYQLLEWCDIAWFEWCDNLLIEATRMPKVCKIVCRLHRYEAHTDYPSAVQWDKVDRLIMVSETIKDDLLLRFPIETPISIVHNGLNLSKFPFQDSRQYGKKVAYVGYIKPVKNPALMIQCFYALKQYDPEFTFHIAGEHQDIAHQLYFKDMLKRLDITVEYAGWVNNVPGWLADKDFITSFSIIESFQYSVAEGMALGLFPLVHTWRGCEQFYPERSFFRTSEEFVERVREYQMNDLHTIAREHRFVIETRFSMERMCEEIDTVLMGVVEFNKK